MPRTKRRFEDNIPESDEDTSLTTTKTAVAAETTTTNVSTTTAAYPRTHFGGGKQLSRMIGRHGGGGGKQIRTMPEPDSDDDDEQDSDEDDESGNDVNHNNDDDDNESSDEEEEEEDEESDVRQPQQIIYNRGFGGGKQLRPPGGGGKMLRYPTPADDSDEDSDEDSKDDNDGGDGQEEDTEENNLKSDNDDNEEEEEEPQSYAVRGGGKSLSNYGSRGGGKSLSNYGPRGGGKSLSNYDPRGGGKSLSNYGPRGGGKSIHRPPSQDDSDSEEEEEKPQPTPTVITAHTRRGGGKVLRRYDEVDEDDEDEDEEEENSKKETRQVETNDDDDDNAMEVDSDSEEEKEVQEVKEKPVVAPPPKSVATRRSTRSTKKIVEESEAEDMEESSDEEEEEVEEMEESEEESSDEESSEDERELDMDTLDQNDLIEGDEDQKYLDSLPEIERESILAQRFEKKKAEMDMKKALRENKRREREMKRLESGKPAKRINKAKKKTATKKPVTRGKKGSAAPDTSKDAELAKDLGLGRAAKTPSASESRRQAALAQLRKDRKSSKFDEDSDLDYGENDDEDSDEEYAESKPWMKKKPTRRPVVEEYQSSEDEGVGEKSQKVFVEADVTDFQKVTIPRRRLARWCNEPYFEKAVMNFYVKLAIGRDEITQKPCYRLCKIVGVKEAQDYLFPSYKGQPQVATNKWLNLKFRDSNRYFKMIMISDSKPDPNDVSLYHTQLKNRRGGSSDVLSKKEANSLRKKQDNLINNYNYTAEDVEKSIQISKNLNKKISNIGAEKTRVNIAVQAARNALEDAKKEMTTLDTKLLEVDVSEEKEIKDEIEFVKDKIEALEKDLEKKVIAQKKILDAEASRINQLKNNEKNRKWAKVNERAIAANKAADVEAYKKELALRKSGQKEEANPYARRKVKPINLWSVGQEKKEDEKDATNTTDKAEISINSEVVAMAVDEVNASGDNNPATDLRSNLKKKLSEQVHDMSIDEESIPRLMLSSTKKPVTSRVRKGISLAEYFERKAAGTL